MSYTRVQKDVERYEMEALLGEFGFNPEKARALQAEGMGTEELLQRLRVKSGVGSLQHTHGLKKASQYNLVRRRRRAAKRNWRKASGYRGSSR